MPLRDMEVAQGGLRHRRSSARAFSFCFFVFFLTENRVTIELGLVFALIADSTIQEAIAGYNIDLKAALLPETVGFNRNRFQIEQRNYAWLNHGF